MGKIGYVNLALALSLAAGILCLYSDPRPWAVDSEKSFIGQLHNSLYYLNQAKFQWAEEHQNSEQELPTLQELTPYLGNHTNLFARMLALGVTYTITSTGEPQSDIATLTRDIRFRSGYCLLYSAGITYDLRSHWAQPPHRTPAKSFRRLWIENNLDHLFVATLVILAVANLIVFVIKRHRPSQQPPRFQET